jgi:hypothetical protein
MTRKVLIVSPHFPPIDAADHQRVRMALPFFEQFGWQPTVLAVDPRFVDGVVDSRLEQTLPDRVQVVRTRALPLEWMQLMGISSLAYRAKGHLRRAGEAILRNERFDLAFFSTTLFPVMTLGPWWYRRFGLPYVLDFQDPWLSDYYVQHPKQRPPGGSFKYGVNRSLAKWREPPTVRGAGHIVSVSAAYAKTFMQRYPELEAERFTTLPFGASESDFSALSGLQVTQSAFDPRDEREHWVYVGRGGQDMSFAVRAFFTALRRHLDCHSELEDRLRIHFIGTDYAPKSRARKTIEPLARECGVEAIVIEQTDRLPYLATLRCLSDAQALFIPGSDDPGYTASKLYPYIQARKPMLAVFHEASSVVDVLRATGAGRVVTFGAERDLKKVADEIYRRWFECWPLPAPATDWNAFASYTAKEMTRRLCDVFDRVAVKQND